jgi:hypothetical protein
MLDFREMIQVLDEQVLYEDEFVNIREAQPIDIPRLFYHKTTDRADILSIQRNGFDLSKFGRTGRRCHMQHCCLFDPKGVYCLALDNYQQTEYDKRPYVIFQAHISKAIVVEEKSGSLISPKQCLSHYFGNKTGGRLTNFLQKKGYQAILRPHSEQIIFDPSIIRIVRVGNV